MEKLARIFFVFTLIFAAAFIIFFLLYFRNSNEAEKFRVEKVNLSQQVETLTMELNRVNVTNQELERKLTKYSQNVNESELTQLATYTSKIDTLNAEIKRLEDELEKKAASVNVLSSQIESMMKGAGNDVTQASTETDESIARMKLLYETEIEKYQNELFDKNEELDDLKKQLQDSDDIDQRTKDLQQRVADMQKSIENISAERDALKASEEKYRNDISLLNLKINELSDSAAAIEMKDKEILGYKNDIEKYKTEITNLKEEVRQLNATIKKNTDEIQALKKQMETEKRYDPIPAGEEDALRYKYLLLGEDRLSAGDSKESARYFENAKLETLALSDLSKVYEKKRDLAFRKAISEYYNEGYSFYKDKSYEKAIPLLENAVKYSQTVENDYHDDSLYYLGLSYFNLKDFDNAEKYLITVSNLNTSILQQHSLYYLVKSFVESGDEGNALTYAEKLMKFDSYKDYAKSVIDKLKG